MMLTKDIIWRLGNTIYNNNEKQTIHFISDYKWDNIWTITANTYFNDDRAAMRLYCLSIRAMDVDSLSEYYDKSSYPIFNIIDKWKSNNIRNITIGV